MSLNISSTSRTHTKRKLCLDITFRKPCKRNGTVPLYPVTPWHLIGCSDVMDCLQWAHCWLLRQMKCCGSWRGVHIMFLTSLWLLWPCVLHIQSVLLPRYEVTHLKYATWREHSTVWVSGTVHSCLCYSPRMLKARSICTHFEKKVLLNDFFSRPNLAVKTSVDRWRCYLCCSFLWCLLNKRFWLCISILNMRHIIWCSSSEINEQLEP